MFEKQKRTGLIVKLYYNRDGKKLQSLGDILYHSKKCRYVQLYVDSDKADQIMEELKKERFVKTVLPCYIKDLDTDFVGFATFGSPKTSYRVLENAIILQIALFLLTIVR